VPERHPDHGRLRELEPVAERLLNRHLSMAKEWMPHQYVPWKLGRDFDTEPWTPDQPRLTGVAQAAFEVNLLTEDNLPSYHRELLATFGPDGPGGPGRTAGRPRKAATRARTQVCPGQ
jgi:acyl-[acyl-carrier-protein] desaturase